MASDPTQKNRWLSLKTPLGPDALLVRRMTGTEALGRLFHYDLDVRSTKHDIKLDDLLGKSASVKIELPSKKFRYVHGLVSAFEYQGPEEGWAAYRITLRPWLWVLTRTSDCKIFQDKKVPDIVKEVFRTNGFSDFEFNTKGSYRTWEYCVQYRETSFNFVSRLLEQEGAYYYFKHEENKHTLVVRDGTGHEPAEGYKEIIYHHPDAHAGAFDREHISDWTVTKQVLPGKYAHTDYNFKTPSADISANTPNPKQHAQASHEIYDYPGEYEEEVAGTNYAKVRLQEIQSEYERGTGTTNARGLQVGSLFKLVNYPRSDQNREYLVTQASYTYESDALAGSSAGGSPHYSCTFTVIPTPGPFRPARITPKPVVQGPQTAIVTGPPGEEIYCDEHGRVKVHFFWHRYDQSDDKSSCWIRVSHPWAGQGWGAVSIPRIGQEVIVDFIEGDPDRPIITGRVYNAEVTAPFPLPAQACVSGIKSNSTKGGGGYNEMAMDDTKGNELVRMHAQFDMDTTVENDQRNTIHNNRTTNVDVNDTETIGSNQDVTVGANRSLTVGANQTTSIGAAHSRTVGASETISVGASKAETIAIAKALTIGAAYQVTVGAAMNESIGGVKAEEIGGAKVVNVGGGHMVNVGGSMNNNVGGSKVEKIGANATITCGGNMGISASKVTIEAKSEITLKSGGASITLKSGGDVVIKGSKITIKGSGDVILKGSKITEN